MGQLKSAWGEGDKGCLYPYFRTICWRWHKQTSVITLYLWAEDDRPIAWNKTQGFESIRCRHKLHRGKISSMGKRTAPAWGVNLRSRIETWGSHGDLQRVPQELRSCWVLGVALWQKRDKPQIEDMYLVWMLLIVSNSSHDLSRRCGFHGYTVSSGNKRLKIGSTTQNLGKGFLTLLHKMPLWTPEVTFRPPRPSHMCCPWCSGASQGSLYDVLVFVSYSLWRDCASL